MANTRLQRLPSTTGNNSKNTFSVWLKRASIDTEDFIVYGFYDANYRYKATFLTDGKLHLNTIIGGSNNLSYTTNRVFRDTSAWYHIVIAFDSTLGTAGDRCRLYVNGVEETSFATEEHMGSNTSNFMSDNAATVYIGSQATANYFNGSMSHIHFCDGYQYQPSDFAETDTDTGEWRIKENLSVSYGTNGFWILKDGNSVTDASPNSNNFTINVGAGGGLNKTEDCPNNVFATLNPLSTLSTLTYAYGNNQITGVNSNVWKTTFSTLGMNYGSSGKYYYEIKVATLNSQAGIGVWGEPLPQTVTTNFFPNHHPFGFVYKEDGSVSDDSQTFYTGSSFTSGDIIQCALDIDNSKIYFGKNGVWQNSGDPTSGATGTGAVPLEDNGGGAYFFFGTCYGTDVEQANFGNGYFANNPVSSAGTNASGNGIFEYDVPTGYTALSTKGLNL
jgi:hypothetical protein